MITLLGKRELVALVCDLRTFCHGLIAVQLGVIGRLCSVIVPFLGRLLYYFQARQVSKSNSLIIASSLPYWL